MEEIHASELQVGDVIEARIGWRMKVVHVEPYTHDLYEIQGVMDGDNAWVIDDYVKLVA